MLALQKNKNDFFSLQKDLAWKELFCTSKGIKTASVLSFPSNAVEVLTMILGGKLFKASVEKFSEDSPKGFGVNVDLQKMELKDKLLVVDYAYALEYLPKVAKMELTGQLYYQEEEKKLKEIKENWEKTKDLDTAFAEDVLNAITHTGRVAGTLLSFAVGVPAPIESQKLTVEKPKPSSKKAA